MERKCVQKIIVLTILVFIIGASVASGLSSTLAKTNVRSSNKGEKKTTQTFTVATKNNPAGRIPTVNRFTISWDVLLSINEPGGAHDSGVFGEAPDAHDGPPADTYDVAKPPAPIPPYVRVWFNDNLAPPYNQLWMDYRHYPGVGKTWNVSVQWVPQDYVTPTTVIITWNSTVINTTEYTSILLCTTSGSPLKNMLLYNSYTFSCPANVPQGFKIICHTNQPPNIPNNPTPANGATGISLTSDLNWTGGDPDGDTVTYDVYFGTISPPPKQIGNQSTTSYDTGTMTYNTTYYWRIVAWDTHHASTPGPLWHFTTMLPPNHPPNVPSNPRPSNGAGNVSLTVVLYWTGGDPDASDTVTYDVYFGTTQPLPKLSANQTAASYPLQPLQYNTRYYWKIVAWDNHQARSDGPVWSFTTKPNSAPSAPIINGPASGTIGKIYNYTFVATDPEQSNISYEIDWGDGTIDPWYGPVQSNQVITRSHTWTQSGAYTIRARAKDINGATGAWGTLSIRMPTDEQQQSSPSQHLFQQIQTQMNGLR